MAISNYPNGFANGVSIRGIPLLSLYPGSVWWVDSVNGSNATMGKGTQKQPFASLDYATGKAKAGDIIIAKPGHVETISAAGSLTCDTAGVCYIFLGQGSNKAYLNFTATAGTVLVTAANVTFINPRIVAGIDAVASAIVAQAADFAMYNVEDFDAAAKAITIGVLTTSAAHRLLIDGYRYHASTTGTQKTERIKTVGALDHIQLYNLDIYGDFSNAPVNMSNAACTNVDLKNLNLNNTNTAPKPGLSLHANTTGWAEDVRLRVYSGTTYVDSNAKLQWGTDCVGYNTDGSGGSALGTATDITAKVDSVGVQASTNNSLISSVGATASTAVSQATSIGTGVSTANSVVGSIATGVSNALSAVQSVGIQASTIRSAESTIDSKVTSVGATASVVNSVVAANAASVASVGVQTSVAHAQVESLATSVASQAASVGTGTSVCNANVLSTAASVASTAASVGTGTSVCNANIISTSNSVTSVGTSVGTGTSICNANVISTSNSVTSVGTSLGTGVSTVVNTSAQTVSILNSLALIISTINSKT